MTGENNKKKSFRPIYLLLLFILIIPTSFLVVLLIQNNSMKKQLIEIEKQVYSYEDKLLEIENKVDLVTSKVSQEKETVIYDTGESFEKNAEELESRVIWDEFDSTNAWDSNLGIRRVYLTFDDGPSSNTDKILDILNEYGVKATFFVVGKEGYNAQYQRIVSEGHTLGMHSYSHKYGEIYKSVDSYKNDLYKLHDFLYEVTGVDSRVVRFPGGSSNTVSKVDIHDLITFLNQEGLTYFDWNVSSGDATSSYVSADTIRANVLNNTKKFNSVIILFHDSSDKGTTVAALPGIIESILKSDNTVLLPITEDTALVQHVAADYQQGKVIGGE